MNSSNFITDYSHYTQMLESVAENTDLDGGLLDHFAYGFFGTEVEELNLMVVGEIHEPSVVGKIHILFENI